MLTQISIPKHFFILSVIILFFFSGCLNSKESDDSLFVGGDEAIRINFVGDNPPDRIFQNRNFDIILLLENVGESEVKAGNITIILNGAGQLNIPGCKQNTSVSNIICKNYLTKEECENQTGCTWVNNIRYNSLDLGPIVKAETGYFPGGAEYISFEELKYIGRDVLTSESPLAISVEICYPYKTTSVSNVCIVKSIDSKICNPSEVKEVYNSGAPVIVDKIEQLGSFIEKDTLYIEVKIDFKQIGSGEIYSIDSNCTSLNIDNLNKVAIDSISIGNQVWKRTGQKNISSICGYDIINLNEGETDIICDIPIKNVFSDYSERFTITLEYKHHNFITKDISVMPSRWS